MPNALAANKLDVKVKSMYIITFNNNDGDFIRVGSKRGKVYVKRSWVDKKLARKHLSDIYTPLLEKYGTEKNIITEARKRTGRTYQAVYQAVRTMCTEPTNIQSTKITEALCEMARDDQ